MMQIACPRFEFFRRAYVMVALLGAALIFSSTGQAKSDLTKLRPKTIPLQSSKFDLDYQKPEQKVFGKLLWRGGLVLSSPSSYFGGFSGLELDKMGKHMLAVSDSGVWLTAEITYDGKRLRALKNPRIGPIRGKKGRIVAGKGKNDAEAITLVKGDTRQGTVLIAFEQRHRIGVFPVSKNGPGSLKRSIKLPKEARRLKGNMGLEGIAIIKKGRLKGTIVAFAERWVNPKGYLQGWLIGGATPGKIWLRRLKGYDITGLAALPDGGLLVLERRFRLSEGLHMRIRRIRSREIKRRAKISGEVLFEARANHTIDNMEGMAVHRSRSGETIITIISDDNHNLFQRTLLMQFALPSDKPRS